MSTEEGVETSTRGFAELMNNFNKLTQLESRIEAAIPRCPGKKHVSSSKV